MMTEGFIRDSFYMQWYCGMVCRSRAKCERTYEREDGTDGESNDTLLGKQNRRTVLNALAAAGLAGIGGASATGTVAAQEGGTELEEIEIDEVTVYAEEDTATLKAGEKLGTFSGVLEIDESAVTDEIEDLAGSDEDALTAIEITEGKLEGEFKSSSSLPSGEVKKEWSGSPLLQLIGLDPDDGECPILFLELGPLFLDLLGLQVSLSQITLDITAVAGPGNLLGNLLCAVAGLLDP